MRARPPAFKAAIAATRLALPLLLACTATAVHAQQRGADDPASIEAPDGEDADASKVPLAEIRRYVAVYNAVKDRQYISILRDVHAGKTTILPRPIYAVSNDGKQAVSLPFDRLHRLRPGYGYCALPEKLPDDPAPAEAERAGGFDRRAHRRKGRTKRAA